jgi:hypothetical protein
MAGGLSGRPLRFEAYESLADRPHVMVDGAARASSVLTLSHWPQSPTPPALARDISVASVLAYVRLVKATCSGRPVPRGRAGLRAALANGALAEAVTNDHFDEDGLMSVYALVDPEAALSCDNLLTAVAMCGDFGVVSNEQVARVAFAMAPLADAEAGAGSGTPALYEAVLPRVPELLAHPDRFERFWGAEAGQLAYGRAALASGEVEIVLHNDLDLAVVSRISGGSPSEHPAGAAGGLPVHAAVVHSSTTASRIVAFDGQLCDVYLRYEGWVKMVSRAVPLRPDLAPLAEQLSAEEPSGVGWQANGVGAIVARLCPGGEGRSELDPARIVSVVRQYLATAEPAWDPWRPAGGYIPVQERPGYMQRRRRHPKPGRAGAH